METGTESAYGTWTNPSGTKTVRYSLAVFHEIGFLVNEGYRRIPYGGIEHGGFLLGSLSDNEIRIDAFRQIEAEHAAGPSFVLSETDITRAKEQLQKAAGNSELVVGMPVGLFISHARRDFESTDDERRLLKLLVPEPARLLVLAKPEKFKRTRFAFVLPGESAIHIFTLPPLRPSGQTLSEEPKKQRHKATIVELPLTEAPATEPPAVTMPQEQAAAAEMRQPATVHASDWRIFGIVAALSIAALLGCVLYFDWNYWQAPVELHAAAVGSGVAVSWPAKETIRTSEAKLHIWSTSGHRTIDLTDIQKASGRAEIDPPGPNFTLELVAWHWLHERRGMLRVVNK